MRARSNPSSMNTLLNRLMYVTTAWIRPRMCGDSAAAAAKNRKESFVGNQESE